jgi:HJR/Mrr/RecB family endonuclease
MRPDPVFSNLKVYDQQAEPVPEARPRLEDFGLNNDIDFETLKADHEQRLRRARRIEGLLGSFAGLVVLGGVIFSMISGMQGNENTLFFWGATFVSGLLILKVSDLYSKVPRDPILADLASYEASLSRWEQHEERKKLNFWRNLKGTDFEREVAKLFVRFKWWVATTPTTGDRGVDLIVTFDGQTYWCQCKGHAKPVAGAEVRRIAGATIASSGDAIPVLIASNGFTKPALQEARDLGVICIDGVMLSQASRSTIPVANLFDA